VQRLIDGAEIGLNTAPKPLAPPPAQPISGGSDDIGDVSWIAPNRDGSLSGQYSQPAGPQLVERHRDGDADRHKGIVAGSKAIAMTLVDLLTRPELVREAKTYFTDVQLKNNKVLPLLAETDYAANPDQSRDDGALSAARCAPLLFMISAKYDTYLDQFGA